jgi:hypothetical protein
MAEQWLSIVEYARTFAVSDMTVRRRIKTGRLKAVLREGKYYIPVGAGHEPIVEDPPLPEVPRMVATPPIALPVAPLRSEETLDYEAAQSRTGASFRTLPQSLSHKLQHQDTSLVETQALLQFCDHSLTRINSIERNLQETYQLRLQSLEAQIKLKDATITQLKQQVEDLQMLVKLMEQSTRAHARG